MIWPFLGKDKSYGNPDAWQLLCKAKIGDKEKSTKVYEIKGVGCLVQVTTNYGDHCCAEALQFVPGVKLDGLVLVKDDGPQNSTENIASNAGVQ